MCPRGSRADQMASIRLFWAYLTTANPCSCWKTGQAWSDLPFCASTATPNTQSFRDSICYVLLTFDSAQPTALAAFWAQSVTAQALERLFTKLSRLKNSACSNKLESAPCTYLYLVWRVGSLGGPHAAPLSNHRSYRANFKFLALFCALQLRWYFAKRRVQSPLSHQLLLHCQSRTSLLFAWTACW